MLLRYRLLLYVVIPLMFGLGIAGYHIISNQTELLMQFGIDNAEQLNSVVFEDLYTSMRNGGGRNENRAVIERLKKVKGIEDISIMHGPPIDRQFGIELDERPVDDIDREAIKGLEQKAIERDKGYRVVRFVKPIFVKEECKKCHIAEVGEVNGVISIKVSLKEHDAMVRNSIIDTIFIGVGILFITGIICLFFTYRSIMLPMKILEQGISAVDHGDFKYRIYLKTGDVFQHMADVLNNMAQQLGSLYSNMENRVAEKTKVLQDRIDELERFHKATIQREFRIQELKEKAKELEQDIEKLKGGQRGR